MNASGPTGREERPWQRCVCVDGVRAGLSTCGCLVGRKRSWMSCPLSFLTTTVRFSLCVFVLCFCFCVLSFFCSADKPDKTPEKRRTKEERVCLFFFSPFSFPFACQSLWSVVGSLLTSRSFVKVAVGGGWGWAVCEGLKERKVGTPKDKAKNEKKNGRNEQRGRKKSKSPNNKNKKRAAGRNRSAASLLLRFLASSFFFFFF